VRTIRFLGASVFAVALVVVLGTADAGGGAAPLAITHPPRIPVAPFGGGIRATWASSNWSGYAETGHYTAVNASWTVPTVTPGANSGGSGGGGGFRFGRRGPAPQSAWYSATWTGIDGFNDANLIQAGTEQDYYSGSAHYSAWWEILPAAETVIPKPVSPGDSITALIAQTPTQVSVPSGRSTVSEYEWTITLTDTSTAHASWTYTITQPYAGAGTSAEWVVEAPDVNGSTATIADYDFPTQSASSGDFNTAKVATSIGGPLSGAGLNFANDAGTLIQNNQQVSTPGQPDFAQTAFNSLYGATAPGQPTS